MYYKVLRDGAPTRKTLFLVFPPFRPAAAVRDVSDVSRVTRFLPVTVLVPSNPAVNLGRITNRKITNALNKKQ